MHGVSFKSVKVPDDRLSQMVRNARFVASGRSSKKWLQATCLIFSSSKVRSSYDTTEKSTMFCINFQFEGRILSNSRSRWPRGLRRGSAAARLLELGVGIPPGARMSVSCECCVFSGKGLCVELITRPLTESVVCECDSEASMMRSPWPTRAVAPWKCI